MTSAEQPAPTSSPVPSLAVSVTQTEGTAVITFRGDLDLSTQDRLRRTLADMVRLRPALVVVDLSQVGVFDCGAIGEFVRARSELRAAASTLVLRSPSVAGRRALQLLGLSDLVSLASPRAGAPVADVNGPASTIDRVPLLLDAWRTACETHATMSWPIVFREPERIIDGLLQTLDVEHGLPDGSSVRHCLPETLSQDAPVAKFAVVQLLELRRVMEAWIEWSVFPASRHRPLQRRLSGAIDASLLEVVSAALSELEHAALVDPLTGLMNRRALERDLTQFLSAALRHQRALTVVMLDVVGLKSTNDRLGHEAGDDLLQDVAAGLVDALRVGDNVYRIGGDEFVLLLPDLRPEDVDAVMERTVLSAGAAFTWGSAGVPTDAGVSTQKPSLLLKLADERMIEHRAHASRVGSDLTLGLPPGASRFAGDSPRAVRQLDAASHSHLVIEQAIGVIAEKLQLDIPAASAILQQCPSHRRESVRSIAFALTERRITVAELVGGEARSESLSGGDAGVEHR